MSVIRQSLYFLLYIAGVLFLGVYWAKKTIRDYPESKDLRELKVIMSSHTHAGVLVLIAFGGFKLVHSTLNVWVVTFLAVSEFAFILVYEMYIPRIPGISAGPGVPLLSRKDVRNARDWLFPKIRKLRAWFSKERR